jgi:hypothetical protein
MISNRKTANKLILYPLAKPIEDHDNPLWDELEPEEGGIQPIVTISNALFFKDETKDDTINKFISNPSSITQPTFHLLDSVMNKFDQQFPIDDSTSEEIPTTPSHKSFQIKNELGKTMNINPNMSPSQKERSIQILHEQN